MDTTIDWFLPFPFPVSSAQMTFNPKNSMSRNARVVVPEVAHHITQRGVRKSDIFRDAADYWRYTDLVSDNCRRHGVLIRAYCWMANHVHLVAVPLQPESFARAFRRAHSIYARWFNKKYGLSGYLWQDRYFSCPLDDAHFRAAIRYVERNPVRAGLVSKAEDYRWSSATCHCFGRPDPVVDPNWNFRDFMPDWANWLTIPNDPAFDTAIRENTRVGWPSGDEGFVANMEAEMGRILRVQRRGPKPKPRQGRDFQLRLLP